MLAGLAGAHLSLGYTTMFTENMSSGRGFMAVAILIFSNGDPLKILLGCLLFGFSDALSLRLQTFGVSSYIILAVPYLVALAALFALSYRARPRIIQETLATMGRALSVKPNSRHGRLKAGPGDKMERIILDVDSAGDDILAVLFAAVSPSMKLEGVTTCTGAAGPIEQVTNVVLNTLALAGRERYPGRQGRLAADRRQFEGRHAGAGPFREAARRPLRRPAEEVQSRPRRRRPEASSTSMRPISSSTR